MAADGIRRRAQPASAWRIRERQPGRPRRQASISSRWKVGARETDPCCCDRNFSCHSLTYAGGGGPETGPILVRSLRYKDRLVRTDLGWRIQAREHMMLWQYDVEWVEPYVPSMPPSLGDG